MLVLGTGWVPELGGEFLEGEGCWVDTEVEQAGWKIRDLCLESEWEGQPMMASFRMELFSGLSPFSHQTLSLDCVEP